MFNNQNYIPKANRAPGNFELDEIQWDQNEQSFHPDLIPFSNTTQKLKEELKELLNTNDTKP